LKVRGGTGFSLWSSATPAGSSSLLFSQSTSEVNWFVDMDLSIRKPSFCVAAVLLAALSAYAYYPPVDTAGPLRVRIHEPALGLYGAGGLAPLNQTGAPFIVTVSMENEGETELRGTLRLAVIDHWKVEPATPVPFAIDGKGRGHFDFEVTIGEGTVNADYPVHAYAEFEHLGKRMVAHPILLLTPRLPNPPRARLPIQWKPVPVPAAGAIGLWRLPIHRESAQVAPGEMLAGITGAEVSENAGPVQYGARVERGAAREAVCMTLGPRPPAFRESLGFVRAEYPLQLPKARPIRLRFGIGGDATFRVRAAAFGAAGDGRVVFERTAAAKEWQDVEADLAGFAGQSIRLQLEAQGNPATTERACFAEPSLVTGTPPGPPVFPPAVGQESKLLGAIEQSGTKYEVRLWPGRRGLLDSAVGFVSGEKRLLFRGFRARVLGDALEDWRSAQELTGIKEEPAGGRYRVRHSFRGWGGSFDLLGEIWTADNVLRARFWLENAPPAKPWLSVHLEEIAAGSWSEKAPRVYGGVGNVIENPQAFQMGFDGHRLASSFVGFDFANGVSLVQAVDVPPDRLEVDPARNVYTLNTPHAQTMTFLPSRSAWGAAIGWRKVAGLHAAGGVSKLAGRFVFDLWAFDLGYAGGAKALQRAFRYGMTDAAVVWHNWQRWGYDYRLPDIYPPNPKGGTPEEFAELARVCRSNGVLFAPHDNYIDFYPDADDFSFEKIVFQRDGTPRKAWYRSDLLAQSYRFRPDCVRPYLERNLRLLKEHVNPNSYFIDVWSSMGPWDFWTHDGKFFDRTVTRKEWGESFAWIREFLGDNAPQISEAGHDQLIGWLDGAQANHLRIEQPPNSGFFITAGHTDAERIPWLDAVVHHVFVLHGAGYGGRYDGGLDQRLHGMYSDDYISTEVLTGHPAMVSMPFGRDVVRKYWLLHGVMRGLAMKEIEGFEFAGGNLHRQHVRWSDGGEVWVNRGADDWQAGGHTLPQYGFYARIPVAGGLAEAAIERRDGVIVEWARSPENVYAGARPVVLESERESAALPTGPDPRPARMNPENKVIGFGGVATNGGVRLTRDGDALMVTPLPSSPHFVLRLDWDSLPWKVAEAREAEALDEDGRVLWRSPITKEGSRVVLSCDSGVFAYRVR
jgi:hypothetical protein